MMKQNWRDKKRKKDECKTCKNWKTRCGTLHPTEDTLNHEELAYIATEEEEKEKEEKETPPQELKETEITEHPTENLSVEKEHPTEDPHTHEELACRNPEQGQEQNNKEGEDIVAEIIEKILEQAECRECSVERDRTRRKDCEECGEALEQEEDLETVLVGMDVVALFPSMTANTTARIVRERVTQSNMQVEGFRWKKAAVYIRLNRSLIDKIPDAVKKYLPVRRKT